LTSIFSCGSLGCLLVPYEQKDDPQKADWYAIGTSDDMTERAIEVAPADGSTVCLSLLFGLDRSSALVHQ
jgi:hypothetical protein